MHKYWFSDGCEHEAATISGKHSWGCWEVQEIDEKTELPDDDQTGHQIYSQCGESIFVTTESYPLRGSNENFEVSEESSKEKALLFKLWTYPSSMPIWCRLSRVPFWQEVDHRILCRSWRKYCVMNKQESECDLWIQWKVRVEGDDKCDIKANLDQRFIDRHLVSPRVSHETIGDNKATIYITENVVFHKRTKHIEVECHMVRKKLEEKIIMTKHVT